MRPPIAFWWPNFWFLQNMQQLIDFAWIPRSGLSFLEPISMVAFTISHFFEFCRKFCDPSCYFDDLISVFAKSVKNQGSEKSWKFSRPLWRSPNCFFLFGEVQDKLMGRSPPHPEKKMPTFGRHFFLWMRGGAPSHPFNLYFAKLKKTIWWSLAFDCIVIFYIYKSFFFG